VLPPQGVEGELRDRQAPLPERASPGTSPPRCRLPARSSRSAVLFSRRATMAACASTRSRPGTRARGSAGSGGCAAAAAQDVGGMPRGSSGGSCIRSTTSASTGGGQKDEAPVVRLAIRTESSSGGEQVEAPFHRCGRENSRAKTFPVPWGTKAGGWPLPQPSRLRSSCRPADERPRCRPSSAASRAMTTASPGAPSPGSGREIAPRQVRADRSIRFHGPRAATEL